MVRVISSHVSNEPKTWLPQYYSQGYQAMIKVAASVETVIDESQFPLVCRKTHKAHSLGVFYGENPLQYSFTLILVELVFIIAITWILRFLLKPLKQPRVVSEILGAIIIGPSVLGRNKTFSKNIFPDNAQFVVRNVGVIGFMYFLFIAGVKMDLSMLKKSGKKQLYTALTGVILPIITVTIVGFLTRENMGNEMFHITSIGAISSALSITSFPVVYPILKELNLLNSEVGRLAMTTSIISDAIGINFIVLFEAIKQGEGAGGRSALWYVITLLIIGVFMLTAVRRLMSWVINKTPVGRPVSQAYVVCILLSVFVMGFFTDMFGMAIANGPLWLGLMIPAGPPLGATLVERSETLLGEFFMPFAFATVGLYTDVAAMSAIGWKGLSPLLAMFVTGYASKVVGTLLPSLLFEMTFRDSLTLSLIMELRGQVELLLYLHWMDKNIITPPYFPLLVLLTLANTAIAGPLISTLYDPTRPYMVNKRRTIQHHQPNTELGIVVCIHDQESVTGLINILEVSYPTVSSPFSVYAVHLVELVGRGIPLFIDYDDPDEPDKYPGHDTIHNALKIYQESRGELKFHGFTAIAPERTMYQDICELALENKATLIILLFKKDYSDNPAGTEFVRNRCAHSVNRSVLDHAPCSVAILVDKGNLRNPFAGCSMRHSIHHFVVLFLGGPDAREALAYADRMVGNPDVSLTVVRFLSHNGEGDNEMEKKLDDGVVTWFWVKNEANERVAYREVVVRNGAETVAAIQAINDGSYYDLWIMGRKQGINPVLVEGLSNWSENIELGIIGDYVASADFGGAASVLVVQQQVLRGQGSNLTSVSQRIPTTSSSLFSQLKHAASQWINIS